MRAHGTLAAFALFSLLVVGGLHLDALSGERVLSQADILFAYAPWSAHAPAGFTRPGNDLLGDVPRVFHPFLQETAAALRAGRLPLWTPALFGGHPFLASFQTATFSPFTVPGLVLPAADALLAAAVAKLLVGGMGMWLLLARFGLSPAAVWFGATAYLLNPFSVAWVEHPVSNVAAWLPWLLWACDRLLASQTIRDVAVLAAVTAVTVLAGHPETSYKALLLAGAYVITGVVVSTGGATAGARLRSALRVVCTRFVPAAALGFLLAGIQLVPFAEYLVQSDVWTTRRGAAANPYPAAIETMVTAIVPNFLGNPSTGLYLPMQNAYGVISNFCEQLIYPGIAVWVTAAVGVVARRGGWRVRFFAGSVLVAAGLMYGVPGLVDLLALVPGGGVVVLTRFGGIAIASAIVLAAFGIDALTATARGTASQSGAAGAPDAPVAVWPALAIVGLMTAGVAAYLGWARPFLTASGLLGATLSWTAAALVMGFLITVLVFLRARGRLSALAFGALAVAAITVDLFALGWRFHPMVPRAQVFPSTPAIDVVRSDAGLFRIAGIDDAFIPNAATAYGLQDLRGYDGMQPLVHGDVAGISHEGGAYRVVRATDSFHVLDLMNVKYVFAERAQRLPAPHFIPVLEDGSTTLYRNERAFPRAFLVSRIRTASRAESLRLIREGAVDLRREAVLYEPLPHGAALDAAAPGEEGVARVTRYEHTHVALVTAAAGRRLLVLGDLDYPGWRATIDGAPAPIVRVNRGLRGVVLPAGRHVVAFDFAPLSVRIGAALTLCGGAGLAALFWLGRPQDEPWRS